MGVFGVHACTTVRLRMHWCEYGWMIIGSYYLMHLFLDERAVLIHYMMWQWMHATNMCTRAGVVLCLL